MSFAPRYSPDQREAIFALKQQGKSGGEIARLCARGVMGLEPFEIDRNYANRIAREEKFNRREPSPATLDDPQRALRELVARMIDEAERWFDRQKRYVKFDPMEFKRMTSSLVELRKLLADLPPSHNGNGNGNGHHHPEPQGFIEELAEKEADGAAQPA